MATTINRTFSLPLSLDADLHLLVKKRDMSKFVARAVKKELSKIQKNLLENYAMTCIDEGQIEGRSDWDTATNDGLNEFNAY